ncbi:nitrous oxide reductase accessory protein NosL [Anaerobacillus sp. MEB173]|uniref:nitrous oxide reductase accessory protein NosL n=1 Tax=Anaerobacillus sp. MEB173 TaxID=3383345 RepID=UPI003F90B450
MKRIVIVFVMLIVSIGLMTGCGNASLEPVEITLDVDKCYTCHMGIEDLQSASQTILKDGTPRLFDDIGCMLTYLLETNDEIEVSYVRDHTSGEWIDLSQSYFVHDQNIQTPMSYGFIAFQSQEAAEQFATEHGGELLTYEQIMDIDSETLKQWYQTHTDGHGESEHGEDMDDHNAESTEDGEHEDVEMEKSH